MPEDSDDDDPDEVFGFITMLNLTERKVTLQTYTTLSDCPVLKSIIHLYNNPVMHPSSVHAHVV